MTLDEKRARANHYIDNSGSVDDLKESCIKVYKQILDKS
jgi:dephospho-CoA kinase